MKRPLVVTDPRDEVVELLREAGELAAAVDVPLTVLTVVSQEEYANDAAVLDTIGDVEGTDYSLEPAEYAEEVAETAVTDVLSEFDVEADTVGRYVGDDGDRADEILEVASENDCDYVFLVGRRRSPAGKVLFGDTAQSVILNFDGYVVTSAE